MSLRTEVGPRVFREGLAVAVDNFTPLADRAAFLRRLVIENPSADDSWQVIVGGREIMRFRVLTSGSQRLLFIPTAGTAYRPNFFDWCRYVLGMDPKIPVPLGMTLTVQSIGGATADILMELVEVDPADAGNLQLNHYRGKDFLIPIYWRLNAAVAAVGDTQLDTQDAPPWIPAIFSNVNVQVNWAIKLLALFQEGMGVNTFSGAANHQSITDHLKVFKDQAQILTRNAKGIPNVGAASAAGSANTVFGQRSSFFPPFELSGDNQDSVLDSPIALGGGETLQLLHNITGDVTGGASYAKALVVGIARVTAPEPTGGL